MARVARQNLRLPLKGPKSKHSAAVRFGKEEQQRERALTFVKKSEQAIQSLLRRGADEQIRTAYLFITNEVLYRLSYISILRSANPL